MRPPIDSDYREYLRIGKLAGSLTAAEHEEFLRLMRNDAEFEHSFLHLSEKFTPGYLSDLSKYKDNHHWKDPDELIHRKTFGEVLRSGSGIAVAALFIVGLVLSYFLLNNNQPAPVAKTDKKSPGIHLQLASGQVINLSSATGDINTGTTILNNNGRELSYVSNNTDNSLMNVLTVAPGMDYQVTLSDGSKLWLNSATTIRFPFTFTGEKREITIDGEAYLEVAKVASSPFVVHLPAGKVEVLGTAFNVNSYDAAANRVSLVDGSVKLARNNDEIILKPGLEGVYNISGGISNRFFDARRTLSWKEGIYYFEEASLEEIVKVIGRWFNVKVVVDNDRNKNKSFVGVVNKKRPLDEFLKTLQYVADFKSYYDANGVLHFK